MDYRTRVALGLAGGYLLGRYRKTRWLVMAVALVASKQLGQAAIEKGSTAVGASPELKKLAEQGRETAVALLGHQIQGITDRVHTKTESLRPEPPAPPSGGEAPEGGQPEGDQPESEAGESETEESQAEESQTEESQTEESQTEGSQAEKEPQSGKSKPVKPNSEQKSQAGRERRTQVSGRPDTAARRRR